MTEAVSSNSYQADFQKLMQGAPAHRQPWLRGIREAAFSRFMELGFPSPRQEEWRFTSVAPIARVPFRLIPYKLNGLTTQELSNFSFGEVDCCQLVFVNGAFSEKLSTMAKLPRGARVRSLQSALRKDREKIEPHLTRLAAYDKNPFTALNTAFMTGGAFIYLPLGIESQEMIHLLFLSNARAGQTVTHPRNLIVADRGSRVSIVESHIGLEDGTYFTNTVTEIVVEENSEVEHYKLQRESNKAFHVANLQVLQGRNSRFSSHSIALGGALVRNDLGVVLNAEGAECTLNGLYVAAENQHMDNHTTIDHARPHCASRETYKGILDDQSSGVFNGKIIVRPDAQKTNARQTNKNLLLSEQALVNTTPQLEIFADDVKCTHGATIGQLDDDELFYLRSRGIGEESARTLLTYAFATEILSAVKIKPIQCQIDLVLLTRLTRLHQN